MKRWLLIPIVALAVLSAACGANPLDASKLPDPSRSDAYALSERACHTAVADYGLRRTARYLNASSGRPAAVAHAYVREALLQTQGWEPYAGAGVAGCLAGIRAAS